MREGDNRVACRARPHRSLPYVHCALFEISDVKMFVERDSILFFMLFSCCFFRILFFSFFFLFLFLAQEELAHCLVSSLWSVMVDVLGWLSVDTYGPWLVNFYRQKLRLGAASSAGRSSLAELSFATTAVDCLPPYPAPRTPYQSSPLN